MGVARAGNLETVGQSNAQVIDGSLKFDGVSQYLTRSFGSGNRRTWTWAAWVKRYKFGATNYGLFSYYPGAGNGSFIRFSDDDSGDTLRFYSDTNTRSIVSKEKFRDTGWYHIVISVDTAQGTDTDRVKRYVNGVQQTTNASNTWPSASEELLFNQSGDHFLGRVQASAYGPVAMSQVHFIDGLALGPGYFGFTDPLTNTWRPKKFRAQGTTVNDGTQWSSLVDVSNATVGSGSAANLFDGDLTTKINISAGYVEIDLSSRNVQAGPEGIEVYNNEGGAYTSYQVNGGEVINWQASAGWMSMGGANSKINTIRINYLSGGGVNAAFAFRVNGVIMIDSTTQNLAYGTNGFYLPMDGNTPIGQDQSGKGNNWTPVNFGGSNTLEKATGALPILNTDGGGKVARVGVRTDSAVGTGATCVLALPLVGTRKDYSNQINSGSTEKVLSIEETPSASSAQSNFYGGSYYFDGNRDHIYDPNSNVADYYLNGVNWTVECWVYPTDVSGTRVIMENTSSGSGGWSIQINSGEVEVQLASLFDPTPSNAIIANKWTHIAVVRSGSTTTLYLDGISRGTTATDAGTTSNTSLWIGSRSGGSYSYIGYMSDIRVYKGVAKYTSNFIPASTDPDILPDTPSGVSYSSNVALVPSTDGAVAFDGSGDYLNCGTSNDFVFGTGQFTIEGWIYINSYLGSNGGTGDSYPSIISSYSGATASWIWRQYYQGAVTWYTPDGGGVNNNTATGLVSTKRWHHVAIVREGTGANQLKIYLDGTQIYQMTDANNYSTTETIVIGSQSASNPRNYHDGFISNLHVVKGTALYTSNFTPPTAPITSVANTKLLCCQSNTTAGSAAVSPNISGINNGTVWSSNASGNLLPSSNYGSSIANAFDGSTSTFAMIAASNGDVTATTVALPGLTSGHTVEFYASKNTNAGTLTFNGSTVSLTSSAGWVTAGTANGTSDNFVMAPNPGQTISDDLLVYAVRVNGTILVDPVSTKGNTITGASTFNPFNTDINTVRGQETGYATWDPTSKYSDNFAATVSTIYDGNLSINFLSGTNAQDIYRSTIAASSGKWYCEWTCKNSPAANNTAFIIGVQDARYTSNWVSEAGAYGISSGTVQQLWSNGTNTNYWWTGTQSAGDVFGMALDLDSSNIKFYHNGHQIGSTVNIPAGQTYRFAVQPYQWQATAQGTINFGQNPFKFSPPPGFQPLAHTNLLKTTRDDVILNPRYMGGATYTRKNSVLTPSGNATVRTKDGMSKGKWYAECVWDGGLSGSVIGITQGLHVSSNNVGQGAYGYGYYSAGSFQNNGGDSGSPASYVVGDVIGVAYDGDNGTLTFYKNGSSQGQAFSGLTAYPYYFSVSDGSSGGTGNFTWRFKASEFTQSIPSGYSAFDQEKITSLVTRPDQYVGIATYQGSSSVNQTISAKGTTLINGNTNPPTFNPDFIWIVDRHTSGGARWIFDSVRGSNKYLLTNSSGAEGTRTFTINNNGVSIPAGDGSYNYDSTKHYVAYCWKAGGSSNTYNIDDIGYSTASAAGLTNGTITPSGISANTKSGFSIVTYNSGGSTGDFTVDHGLNAIPKFIIHKTRSAGNWWIYHEEQINLLTKYLQLNSTNGTKTNSGNMWGAGITSSVFGVRVGDLIGTSQDAIAYIWAEVPGFSKFGIYYGASSSDGPRVITGFRPKWVLIKRVDNDTENWHIRDDTRNQFNVTNLGVSPNTTGVEGANNTTAIDILSDGFKLRGDDGAVNTGGGTYIYAAFAQAPTFNLFGAQSNAR